jgi:hypothetical protein
MATIKKNRARKFLEEGPPSPSMSDWPRDGLRFNMTIGDHVVSLTHLERDMLISAWSKMEKQFEGRE